MLAKALGNLSRHRVGAPQRGLCHTTKSCRSGLNVGVLRLICDGSCTTKRFHSDHDEQESRTGMPWSTSLHQVLSRVPEVAPFFSFLSGLRLIRACDIVESNTTKRSVFAPEDNVVALLGGGLVHAFVSAYQPHKASMTSSSFAS